MDVHVSIHPIKTDDAEDGKRYCAVFTAGTPRRVIHVEEADTDAEMRDRVHQLLQRDDWNLATMSTAKPVSLAEVREKELNDAADDSLRELMKVVAPSLASAIACLHGNPTDQAVTAALELALNSVAGDLFNEAKRRAGLSDSEARAELLRLAMRSKSRKPE